MERKNGRKIEEQESKETGNPVQSITFAQALSRGPLEFARYTLINAKTDGLRWLAAYAVGILVYETTTKVIEGTGLPLNFRSASAWVLDLGSMFATYYFLKHHFGSNQQPPNAK